MTAVLVLVIAGAWVACGVLAVALMRRRGHDAFTWAVLFLVLGPIAVPVAVSAARHHPEEPPRPVPPGTLDLLVAHDGTAGAQAALDTAVGLLGQRMTSMTLVAVLDLEAPTTVRGRDAQRTEQARLDELARNLTQRVASPVGTVILFGEPASALHGYAADNGYELIVAGSDAARVASRKVNGAGPTVPVLIGPDAK